MQDFKSGDSFATGSIACLFDRPRDPDKNLFLLGAETISYRQFREIIAEFSSQFAALNISSDDTVAVLVAERELAAPITLAVASSAVAAPLATDMSAADMQHALSEIQPVAIIVGPHLAAEHQGVLESLGLLVVRVYSPSLLEWLILGDPLPVNNAESAGRGAGGTALVLLTSGTSGRPKRVDLRHFQLLSVAQRIASTVLLTQSDRLLMVLPSFHIHGFSTLLASVVAGASVSVSKSNAPESILKALSEEGITWISASPTYYRALLRVMELTEGFSLASLRFLRSASAPMTPDLSDELERKLGVRVVEAYGMTEAGPLVASNSLLERSRRAGSVGKPIGTEVQVVDEERNVVAVGVHGEIVIRGDSVITRYNGNEQDNDAFLAGGWFCTGDLGYIDKDGFLFITGRSKEIINRGGEKILPMDIEAALLSHSSVSEVVAYPAPHPSLGEVPHAVVRLKAASLKGEVDSDFRARYENILIRHCKETLATSKVPFRIHIVDSIPVSGSGKHRRLDLHSIVDELAVLADASPKSSPQCSETERYVMAVWSSVIGSPITDPGSDFFSQGGDSLSALSATLQLEAHFGITLTDDFFMANSRAKQQAEYISSLVRHLPPAIDEADRTEASELDRIAPLTATQQRLWFLEQGGARDEYVMCLPILLDGDLQPDMLKKAFEHVVERHPALHTSIQKLGNQAVQVIKGCWKINWQVSDISHTPTDQMESELTRIARVQRSLKIDLADDSLIRTLLIKLEGSSHALITTVHHIVFDGWSAGIFYRDLFRAYTNLTCVSSIKLPKLNSHFFHYALDEKLSRDHVDFPKRIEWWRTQMSGIPQVLEIPGGKNVSGNSRDAAHLHFSLDSTLVFELQNLANRLHVSLYACLATALKITLYRYTGQESFALGTVSANRRGADQRNMVGMFASTLPMPVSMRSGQSIASAITETWHFLQGSAAHNGVDFEQIVEACCERRLAGITPIFQVMFAYQNLPELDFPITSDGLMALSGEVTGKTFIVDAASCKFDVSLYLRTGRDGLSGTWQYRSEKYDAGTIALLDNHFLKVLQTLVSDHENTICNIPLVSRHQNENSPRQPGDEPEHYLPELLISRISKHALLTPDRIAVNSADRSLTYIELLRAANQLSNYLVSIGVLPGQIVAVLLPRNERPIISALAIMAIGAIYLPLDCAQPRIRLSRIIESSSAKHIILDHRTNGLLYDCAGESVDILRICLDDCSAAISAQPFSAPSVCLSPESSAYVVFTSGSTGLPKGVAISHGSLAHYLVALNERIGVAIGDRYLLTAPLSFSSSMRQIFLPLANGAEILIARSDQVRNVGSLVSMAKLGLATVLDLVPSQWRNVSSYSSLEGSKFVQLPLVRIALSASEPLDGTTARFIKSFCPNAITMNMYGQTETTGIVATCNLEGDMDESSLMPLGTPIHWVDFMLLNDQDEQVPMGSIGQICITGKTLGLGYLNPEDNRDSLGKDRFTLAHGVYPMYRTGDLGRFSVDGTLHYAGRLDSGFKHLGHRVEPAEVEAVANSHPSVYTSIAFLDQREDSKSYRRLRLVYVKNPLVGDKDIDQELRSFLKEHLPSYMVPLKCIAVAEIPLTANGKVDRDALRSQPAHDGRTEQSFQPDETNEGFLASNLTRIWSDVLEVKDVSLEDNFFDLGGNSILCLEVVSAALDAGIDLSLDLLFHHQTLRELVPAIVAQAKSEFSRETQSERKQAILFERPVGLRCNQLQQPSVLRFDVESLRNYSIEVLTKAGLSHEGAKIVTEVQLESSLRGQITHNIGDVPRYANRLKKGILNTQPNIQTIQTSLVSAIVNGDNAPGQWVATVAMDKALLLAEKSGIGVVAVRGSNHYGAAGHYVWQAARKGFIGMGFSNGPVILAPTGGVTPLFGNNPLAVGIPCATRDPVVLDISMSVATRGKIGLALAEGEPLSPGWILDRSGAPSTALQDLAAGLGIPIGGHKGYGLAFVIETLAGALTGAGYCRDHAGDKARRHGGSDIGHFFIVIAPSLFMPQPQFEDRVLDIVWQAKHSELAAGVEEIFVPGEIEQRERQANLRNGVPLQASVVNRLLTYAARHGIVAPLNPV